jgi:hypothetical protein
LETFLASFGHLGGVFLCQADTCHLPISEHFGLRNLSRHVPPLLEGAL